jgi:hypothetical protein
MLRRLIWIMPLTLGMFPLSVQALPTPTQINGLAQKICQLPNQSSQSDYQQAIAQGMGGWMYQGNLTFQELNNPQTMANITNQLVGKIQKICPLRVMEMNNELSNQNSR